MSPFYMTKIIIQPGSSITVLWHTRESRETSALFLTWQVSSRSAGESPAAPDRFVLGKYFCPPVPACWACSVV